MRRCGLLALFASAALAAVSGGAPAGAASPAWANQAVLVVQPGDRLYPELGISLDFPGSPPGKVSFAVPAGFALYPVRPAGSPVGKIEIRAATQSGRSESTSWLFGDVAAEPLDEAAEAAAQECSPGAHIAIWRASMSLLGQPLDLLIYVARGGAGGELRLDVCAPPLSAAGPRLPIVSLSLTLQEVLAPTLRGNYEWRAFVTPLAPDRMSLVAPAQYELRAVVPVPHRLTLAARHLAKKQKAILSGRLTANGRPRAGVRVILVRLSRKITEGGVVFSDSVAAVIRTGAQGRYSAIVAVPRTAGFVAFADVTIGTCTGSSSAPRGCLTTATSGTGSEPLTVNVAGRR